MIKLRNTTLESILSGLNKTVSDLEAFTLHAATKAATKQAEADRIHVEIRELDEQANKASLVMSNLKKLLGD
jgi:hypothetical protein